MATSNNCHQRLPVPIDFAELKPHEKPSAKNNLPALAHVLASYRHDPYSTSGVAYQYKKVMQPVEHAKGYMATWHFGMADSDVTVPEKAQPSDNAVTILIGGVSYLMSTAVLGSLIHFLTGIQILGLRAQRRRNATVMGTGAWFIDVRPEDVSTVLPLHHRVLMHLDRVTIFADGAAPMLAAWCRQRDATWEDDMKATHPMVFELSNSAPRTAGVAAQRHGRHHQRK
jgi:hypothetical protein